MVESSFMGFSFSKWYHISTELYLCVIIAVEAINIPYFFDVDY